MSKLPDYPTERARFEQLISILLDTYRPEGALIWINARNHGLHDPDTGGHSPRDLIQLGTDDAWAQVLNAANLIDGGNW